jgi:short-subunit dehydrogenase
MNDHNRSATTAESANIHPFQCDVTDLKQVRDTIAHIEDTLGSIDRLTHCAAIMPTAPILEQDAELINKMMSINFGGTVNLVKTVLPLMRQRGYGQLVIFGSIAGSVLGPELGGYNATKAATNAFAEVLIHENRGSGVHILLVCPPMVKTPLIEQAMGTKNIAESLEKNRMADPKFIVDEIDKALAKGATKEILLPGAEAKILMLLRRFFPNLLWKIIKASMK